MYKYNLLSLSNKSLCTFLLLFVIAVFAIGGCNDNNGGNNGGGDVDAPDPDTSACTILNSPCTSLLESQVGDDTLIECVLSDMTCAVDLDNVLSQFQASYNVNGTSILWIAAWGGDGGTANENGGHGAAGGYAQTLTDFNDIKSFGNGSSVLYYFLGEPGGTAPGHCGGGGGASTIVTFEDLTLNPASAPTLDPLYMIAGGGGGGSGGTIKGCTTQSGVDGAEGGVLISPLDTNPVLYFDAGSGCNNMGEQGCGTSECGGSCAASRGGGVGVGEGGGAGMGAVGGQRMCCIDNQTGSANGANGFGGHGAEGGQGHNCTRVGNVFFRNASLSFSAGSGGSGGGGTNNCTNGGGGGGGGYGGGGGGGHGGNSVRSQAGGGGGSAAANSTKTYESAPTGRPGNPCGTSGCLTITVLENK